MLEAAGSTNSGDINPTDTAAQHSQLPLSTSLKSNISSTSSASSLFLHDSHHLSSFARLLFSYDYSTKSATTSHLICISSRLWPLHRLSSPPTLFQRRPSLYPSRVDYISSLLHLITLKKRNRSLLASISQIPLRFRPKKAWRDRLLFLIPFCTLPTRRSLIPLFNIYLNSK